MKQLKACLVIALVALVAAGTISLAQETEESRIKITSQPEGAKVTVKRVKAEEAEPGATSEQAPQKEMSESDKAWMEAALPGEAHEFLKQMLGTWDVKMRFIPAPGAEPMMGRGEVMREMVLGGRFLQTIYKGEFRGESFLGRGYDGYDNAKKKYVGVWMDNTGTMIFQTEGELDETGTILVSYGEYVDALTGKTKKSKAELTIRSLSMHSYVMYEMNDEGEWVKNLEVIYGKL